ncbi:TPA: toxin HicA [Candidatus Sumerlaeota bacterium]|jgi:predicted RNA binding protein YcfA (HicA-like mRNA interferase family)|nr:toxin HicA [Candidatus Sumerlaeota bacterium]
MNQHEKLLLKILRGQSDANIPFSAVCALLLYLGFEERIKGSHHVFRKAGVEEKVNVQKDGNLTKGYQIRQIRQVILRNRLGGLNHDE